MLKATTILAQKPVSFWNKKIDFNFKSLFKSISEGIIAYFSGNKPDLGKSIISLIDVFEFKESPESLAYSLVIKALQQSILEIINENISKLSVDFKTVKAFYEYKEYKELAQEIETNIEKHELIIGLDFFENPSNISLIDPVISVTSKWLEIFGLNKIESDNSASKIKSYFIYFLNDIWRSNSDEFQILLKNIITPFENITKTELEWQFYHSYLIKQVYSPVFDESFGLKDIFIPPYGFYEKFKNDNENNNIEKHVIEVKDFLENWISKTKNSEDSIKVISGGPGSGKSTFAKMYASFIASKNLIRVIYIPLQHLNVKEDLSLSLNEYLKESNFLQHNPLENIHKSQFKLLLIFDGLDELSKQGKHANELSNEFIHEIHRKISNINREKVKLFIILTGRELTIQNQISSFRRNQQVINLLPYYNGDAEDYTDKKGYLNIDLRDEWWHTYGKLKGINYQGFPYELKTPRLDEITAQPLLNYLVALTYERKVVKFDNDTNLNEIFQDLIKAVFNRQYEKNQHKVITELNLSEYNFLRVLEEISISAWHSGDVRTTTIQKIGQHIDNNNLTGLFREFQLGAQAGVTRLLTAFYFRQKGIDEDQNKTFEFTHKSFGEYLVARRTTSILLLLAKKIAEHDCNPDEGIDRKTALKKIIELFGRMPIDSYLYSFISNEIRLRQKDEVNKLQQTIISLIEFVMNNGMPIELLSPRPEFKVEMNYYKNSLLALFIFLKLSADFTEIKSDIKWPNSNSLGEILAILNPQKSTKRIVTHRMNSDEFSPISAPTSALINRCLTNLSLHNCYLASSDLSYSDFSGSELKDVVFAGCDLFGSSFNGTHIYNTNFYRANIQTCSFINTVFTYKSNQSNYPPTVAQLAESHTMENVIGLSSSIITEVEKIKKLRQDSLLAKYKTARKRT